MVGRTLGHYRLLEQVGQGGMAAVYRARDLSLDRECAVKVLHRHLQGDKESRLRFQREAQAVARLRHENILEIYAYSPEDVAETEDSFLVTEFIFGPTLRAQILDQRPRFPEIGAMVGCEVARALTVAHREGIVHRDVKPENIMIRRDGTLVLCDFGIARLLDKDTVTTTGQLLGSPAYMAPEHIKGQHVDSRSDLFSLGVLMYELCSGELPFRGKNPHDTLTRIAAGTHTPVVELAPLCSPQLARVIERALDPNPDTRYQEAELLREELLAALRESGIDDARAELSAYFRDPAAWEQAFSQKLLARLIETGRELRRGGRIAGALAAWGRAQQLAPDDAQVAELLSSLSRGSRRRRVVIFACAGVAAVSAVSVSGHFWHRHRVAQVERERQRLAARAAFVAPPAVELSVVRPKSTPPVPPLRVEPAEPQAASTPPPVDASPTPVAPERVTQRPPRPAAAPPAAHVAPHIVRLEPWPKAVRVTHNGKPLGAYGTDVRTVQLSTGRNEFLFENPACYSERVVLPAGITPEEVRVRLRWKPALLLVKAYGDESSKEPIIADLVVDGRLVGRSGQVVALAIQGDESSRPAVVQISTSGRRTVTRSLTVHANQLSQLELPLPVE